MKITPGPWIVCTCSDNAAILSIEQDRQSLVNEEPSIIGEVYLQGDGIYPKIGTANANAIAAVPEMMHELGGIADALAAGGIVTIEPGSVKAAAIAKAIAKAEGRY